MVSSATYHAVWDGLLEVARAVHYFSAIERRYRRPAFGIRFVLALSGCGSVASLLVSSPVLASISGALVTALVILDLLWDCSKRTAQLKIVNNNLAGLEREYRSLWTKVRNGSIDDSEAIQRSDLLNARLIQIASDSDVSGDDKISQKAQERAFKVEEQRYAA